MSKLLDVRCYCRRRPLLAVCGRDGSDGHPFVHVKAWKAKKLITEVVVTSGVVLIHCRECLRWQRITITSVKADVQAVELPESISVS